MNKLTTNFLITPALLFCVAAFTGCSEQHEPPQAVATPVDSPIESSVDSQIESPRESSVNDIAIEPQNEALAETRVSSSLPSSLPSADGDIVGLKQYINLPVEPSRVVWAMNKVTEPAGKLTTEDWSIVARMELTKEQLKVLTNVPLPNKVVKLPAYTVEPWMEDVIANKFKLDKSGKFYKPLGTMLSAEQFFNDPLVTGAIYMITDNEILLFLQTE